MIVKAWDGSLVSTQIRKDKRGYALLTFGQDEIRSHKVELCWI